VLPPLELRSVAILLILTLSLVIVFFVKLQTSLNESQEIVREYDV
jgi:hypothetical protein